MRETAYLSLLRSSQTRFRDKRLAPWWAVSRLFPKDPAAPTSKYSRQLTRAGIVLTPSVYVLVCVLVGILVSLLSLQVGPVFGLVFGVVIAYELACSLPQERASRRERQMARDLPLCAQTLGQRINAGLPFQRAFAETFQVLPSGILASEIERVLLMLQRGSTSEDAIHQLNLRLHGPEVRSFCVAIRMYCLGGQQLGDPLIQLAGFVRKHRMSTGAVARRVRIIRQLFAGMSIVVLLGAFMAEQYLPARQVLELGHLGILTEEIGGIIVIGALVAVMRLTSSRAWEIADD